MSAPIPTPEEMAEVLSRTLGELVSSIMETVTAVRRIEKAVAPVSLNRDDICRRYLRCSRTHAAKIGPWVWPNFNVGDVPGKPVWFEATCEEWYSVPLETRKAEYFRKALEGRRPA